MQKEKSPQWIPLVSEDQVAAIAEKSHQMPCLIFKHSTRCNISHMAKYRLESDWDFKENDIEPYFLDLIAHRAVSNLVADYFATHHESPQILLIHKGECILDASHIGIRVDEIHEVLSLPGQ